MFSFRWVNAPDPVFVDGIRDWERRLLDELWRIMVEEADNVQDFMRRNAVWVDDCDPSREYLKAIPFRDDQRMIVGIIAYYDIAAYEAKGCKQGDFGVRHETATFARAGIISIILPRRPNTVLGDEAPRIFDRVRAVVGATP